MNIDRLILASVTRKSVYRKLAALSEEEKQQVVEKVKQKLKEKYPDAGAGGQVNVNVPVEGVTPDAGAPEGGAPEGDDITVTPVYGDGDDQVPTDDDNLLNPDEMKWDGDESKDAPADDATPEADAEVTQEPEAEAETESEPTGVAPEESEDKPEAESEPEVEPEVSAESDVEPDAEAEPDPAEDDKKEGGDESDADTEPEGNSELVNFEELDWSDDKAEDKPEKPVAPPAEKAKKPVKKEAPKAEKPEEAAPEKDEDKADEKPAKPTKPAKKPKKEDKDEAGGEVTAAPDDDLMDDLTDDLDDESTDDLGDDTESLPVEEGTPAGDIVDELEDDVEEIEKSGQIDPSRVLDLFDSIMSLHSLLLHAKLPRGISSRRKKTADSIADRLVVSTIADRMAARGLQLNRKDKDVMKDDGGSSKGMNKEPEFKPPRDDCRKPFRTKDKPANERDPDTDNDPDKRAD